MMKKIKNILFRIVYILVIIYLLIFVPSIFGHKPLVVVSGSMEPNLKVGSILYYHKEDLNNFNTADILVYKTKDHIISHRIVSQSEIGFMTKGDANNVADSNEIFNQQVLGKGTDWCIPYIGYYASYIYNHKYILYIAISILIIDLCNDYYTIRKKKVGVVDEENT
ncbi:MAG: signal peptidase I [Bacilli bacterium]